jgi:ribosomal protein S18 acetylase RimI-like enzyme
MEMFIRPAGPADAEDIARVQRESWAATYSGLLSPASIARVESTWDARHWRATLERTDDRAITLVMEGVEDGIIGFGVAGPRRGTISPVLRDYEGEFYLLYLLPRFQRRSHGVRLMAAMARVLRARGVNSAVVWALAANRKAIGFYQHLSGSILMQARKPFFGELVNEIALGWTDIGGLATMTPTFRE